MLSRFPLINLFHARKTPYEYALGGTWTHEIDLDRHADHISCQTVVWCQSRHVKAKLLSVKGCSKCCLLTYLCIVVLWAQSLYLSQDSRIGTDTGWAGCRQGKRTSQTYVCDLEWMILTSRSVSYKRLCVHIVQARSLRVYYRVG